MGPERTALSKASTCFRRQVPGQPCTVALRHAWNAQGKVGRCFAGLEEIAEKVPQMRRAVLSRNGCFACRQVLQEGGDIRRIDL